MPRLPRQSYLENNSYYHVISRSINQTAIFKDGDDFAHFLQLEQSAKRQFPIRLFHYALMSTHFHFVIQTIKWIELPKHLYFLKRNYTRWFNKKHKWRGPLWRERYRSIPIENENYLAACGLYVELNPVKAGICRKPEDYSYSSAKKYFLSIKDPLLDRHVVSAGSKALRSLAHLPSEYSDPIFLTCKSIGSPGFCRQF